MKVQGTRAHIPCWGPSCGTELGGVIVREELGLWVEVAAALTEAEVGEACTEAEVEAQPVSSFLA